MSSANPAHRIRPDVRAAISAFLNESQKDPQPFVLSDALAAIRQIFPELEISDSDLADAITSEALTAGVAIEFDELKTASERKKKSDQARTDAVEQIRRNDTNGSRRRANETKERHRLV